MSSITIVFAVLVAINGQAQGDRPPAFGEAALQGSIIEIREQTTNMGKGIPVGVLPDAPPTCSCDCVLGMYESGGLPDNVGIAVCAVPFSGRPTAYDKARYFYSCPTVLRVQQSCVKGYSRCQGFQKPALDSFGTSRSPDLPGVIGLGRWWCFAGNQGIPYPGPTEVGLALRAFGEKLKFDCTRDFAKIKPHDDCYSSEHHLCMRRTGDLSRYWEQIECQEAYKRQQAPPQ